MIHTSWWPVHRDPPPAMCISNLTRSIITCNSRLGIVYVNIVSTFSLLSVFVSLFVSLSVSLSLFLSLGFAPNVQWLQIILF